MLHLLRKMSKWPSAAFLVGGAITLGAGLLLTFLIVTAFLSPMLNDEPEGPMEAAWIPLANLLFLSSGFCLLTSVLVAILDARDEQGEQNSESGTCDSRDS